MDLKNLAALVVAASALVTAVGACLHRPPEDAARAGYVELTRAILDAQAAQKQDHEDLAAISKAFADYTRSHESLVTAVQAPPGNAPLRPNPAIPTPGTVTHVVSAAPSAAPAPPVVRSLPKMQGLKQFDALL